MGHPSLTPIAPSVIYAAITGQAAIILEFCPCCLNSREAPKQKVQMMNCPIWLIPLDFSSIETLIPFSFLYSPSESHVYFFYGIHLLHQKAIKGNTTEQNQIQFLLFILEIFTGHGKTQSGSPEGLFLGRTRSWMLTDGCWMLLVWFMPAQNDWPCSHNLIW